MKKLEEKYDALMNNIKKNVINVMSYFPEWKLVGINDGYKSMVLTIELSCNKIRGEKRIDIRYVQGYGRFQKEAFSTNVAAMGDFELLDGNDVALYYKAVGALLSQKEKLENLRKIMKDATIEIGKLDEEYKNENK